MTGATLGRVACGVVGLLAIVYAVGDHVSQLLALLASDFEGAGLSMNMPLLVTASVVPLLLLVGGGVLLIVRRDALGARLAGDAPPGAPPATCCQGWACC